MVVAPCKSEDDSEEPELGCCKEGDKEEDEPIVSSSSNVLPIDDPMDSARTDSMDTSGEQVDSNQMNDSSVVFLNDDCCACLDASADPACVLPCGHSCLCVKCATTLSRKINRNRCPYCRVPFKEGHDGKFVLSTTALLNTEALYQRLRDIFLEQRQSERHQRREGPLKCPCGEEMLKVEARNAYAISRGCAVECDICSRIVRGRSCVYHCPQEVDPDHPHGFDLCNDCTVYRTHSPNCIIGALGYLRRLFLRARGRIERITGPASE